MSTLAVVATWDENPAREDLARRMISHLAHRAPDGSEIISAPGAALGFGRLVVSRTQGHQFQPLTVREAGVHLVGDVRIDNRLELARKLNLPDRASGAEVVLAAYQRWGEESAAHLDGDFAFVVWDAGRRRLYAARDPFGVRPLVYRRLPDRLLVASDVEQILVVDSSAWRVDDHAIIDFLLYRWRFVERTFFEPIRAVPPGHCLTDDGNVAVIRSYFRFPERVAKLRDEREALGEFRGLLFEAVKERLESDHPALLHISGGFDASSIACVADCLRRTDHQLPPLRAVGAVYPGLASDESRIMESFKTHLSYPVEFWDGTRPGFRDLDDPALAGPSARVSRNDGTTGDLDIAQREGARVVLGGVGGELFETPDVVLSDLISDGDVAAWLNAVRAVTTNTRPDVRSVLRWVFRSSVPTSVRPLLRSLRHRVEYPSWFVPFARARAAEPEPDLGELWGAASGASGVSQRAVLGPRCVRILDNLQRPASEAGVEMRFPFLDRDVVRFVALMPARAWGPPVYAARLHARALADVLPPSIRRLTRKVSFESVADRRVSAMSDRLRSLTASARWHSLGDLEHDRSIRGLEATDVWAAASLEAWLHRVLGYDPLAGEIG